MRACLVLWALLGAGPSPVDLRETVIDAKVGIGYGIAAGDVDGDRKPDIILVDKDTIAWYRNPGWERHVLVEKLTPIDHVCLAARDLDGDGKVEVGAGDGWNPGDTVGSGSLHYLLAPPDRTKAWEPVKLPHEPTVHRMKWVRGAQGDWSLVVAPLHGRGNKNGEGEGVKVLAYRKPSDPRQPWSTEPLDTTLHIIHNLEVVDWDGQPGEEVLLASKEGVFHYRRGAEKWERTRIAGAEATPGFTGAGEVRAGILPGGRRLLVTVEPFHGDKVAAYAAPAEGPLAAGKAWTRTQLDEGLGEGHAVACGDLLGLGSDQAVVGWRKKDRDGRVGIRLYVPLDGEGKRWERYLLDDNTMACEDLTLADLDGDGRLDLIASGRDTHNLKVYWNQGVRKPAR